jgi:undecaprenyl-diphosphatase
MLEALILGVLQGITEFLPVSSTAHLVLVPWVFKWKGLVDSLAFDVALHAGTLFSLLICFGKDIASMFGKMRRVFYMIVLGSVPAGVAGVFLHKHIGDSFRDPRLIALMLVVFGLVMYASEKFRKKKRTIGSIGVLDAVLIGTAQAMALVPGVSRSGATIAAGLMRGVRRDEAARFSLLLSIPAIAGATALEGRKLLAGGPGIDWTVLGVGFAVSMLTGILAIKFLLKYLRTHDVNVFVVYRFALAGMILGWLWVGG